MKYASHIPAGVAFAATLNIIIGAGLSVPMLVGGMLGGVIPDMDIQGSAAESTTNKSFKAVKKVIPGSRNNSITKGLNIITKIIDGIILKPFAMIHRFIAKRFIDPLYYMIADNVDAYEKWGWSKDKPSAHRGFTHTLLFIFIFCLPIAIINFVLTGTLFFTLGMLAGLISHLWCDSMCRSGIRWFWPFIPKIGYPDIRGQKIGDGIRFLPPSKQVSTGAVQSLKEIEHLKGSREYDEKLTLFKRERRWQHGIMAYMIIACIILLGVTGAKMSNPDTANATDNSPGIIFAPEKQENKKDITNEKDDINNNSIDNDIMGLPSSTTTGVSKTLGLYDVDTRTLPSVLVKLPNGRIVFADGSEITEANLQDPQLHYLSNEIKGQLRHLMNTADAFSNEVSKNAERANKTTKKNVSPLTELFGRDVSGVTKGDSSVWSGTWFGDAASKHKDKDKKNNNKNNDQNKKDSSTSDTPHSTLDLGFKGFTDITSNID